MKTTLRHFFLAFVACTLCACLGSNLSAIATGVGETSESVWTLTQGNLDGKPLPITNTAITLQVDNNTFYGNSGINTYNAPVTAKGSRISVDNIFTTLMAGDIENLKLETDYLSALQRVEKYERNENTLILTGKGVSLTYQLSPVQK